MFIFKNLPSEVNWIILDYYNYFQIEHKRKFILVLNFINQFPKFIEVISTKVCNRLTIYYHFEKNEKNLYLIKKETHYLSFLKKNFSIYI